MKVYIGNKILCLATPEDNEDQAGYIVIYSDGSETWLTKEIFESEFRMVEEDEIDLVISTVAQELTESDLMELMDTNSDPEQEIELPVLVDESAAYEIADEDA